MQVSIIATGAYRVGKRGAITFDAEVALTIYDDAANVVYTTQQRTVSAGHATREVASAKAVQWVRSNLSKVFTSLPIAKP